MRPIPLLLLSLRAFSQAVPNIRDTASCPNTPNGKPRQTIPGPNASGDMRSIVLNAPGTVCNDGAPAIMFVRPARGARSEDYLFDPLTKAGKSIPVSAGDQIYLVLYGTGMRGGAATVGGVSVPVSGPMAQGQYQGQDQINFGPLPLRIGRSQKEIIIRQEDALANTVTVTF